MRAIWCFVLATLVVACGPEPAGRFFADCGAACVDETSIRLRAADVLDNSPGYWRFLDDALEVIERDAGIDHDYLWRHAVPGHMPFNWPSGNRNGLAVNSRGDVALVSKNQLWLFDDAGTPVHAFTIASAPVGTTPSSVLAVTGEVVSFIDDDHVWAMGGDFLPFVADLRELDRLRGPLVDYSWQLAGQLGTWSRTSASVLSDGALVWRSEVTRALAPDGGVKWENAEAVGPFTVSEDGRVFSIANSRFQFMALDSETGETLVTMQRPEWEVVSTFVEGSYLGDRIAIANSYPVAELVVLDSHSGAVVATHEFDGGWWEDDAGYFAYYPGQLTMGRDDAVYAFADQNQPELAGQFFSYSPTLDLRWRLQDIYPGFIVPGQRSNRVFVTFGDREGRGWLKGFDGQTGEELFAHRLVGANAYVPRLRDGVLYLTELIKNPLTIRPSEMSGMVRRDDSVVDAERDYQCLALDYSACQPLVAYEPDAGEYNYLRVVWAFQVE